MRMINSTIFLLLLMFASARGVELAKHEKPYPAVVNPVLRPKLRQTISLDGLWDFAIDPNNRGLEQQWFNPNKELPNKVFIKVPGCWEAQGIGGEGLSTTNTIEQSIRMLKGSYVGTAWYKKSIVIPENWTNKQIWLKIGGVHCQGWFWVNGTFITHLENYCGTYKFNITDLVVPGEKTVLAAKVRNDVTSSKGLFAWIHKFGGLYRSIELDATSETLIDYVYVDPLFDEKKGRFNIKLRNCKPDSKASYQLHINCSTDAGIKVGLYSAKVSFTGEEVKDLQIDLPLEPFNPWSPEFPNLYIANIVLATASGEKIDDWVERFGIRKWEVRGQYFYLNNQKYLVRGFGDDFVYPITLCSPVSRRKHKKHLQQAKDFGFNYVRHHTHCEIPEFFEAADEIGIMIQPELPYYGTRKWRPKTNRYYKNTLPSDPTRKLQPLEDLSELITHYRRFVSLSTYCTGNEGHLLENSLDERVYQLAKKMDPTRLALHQDGGVNTAKNSDFGTGPFRPWQKGKAESRFLDITRPYFTHEYLNLATEQDPRLNYKYTGAEKQPVDTGKFMQEAKQAGLSMDWAFACIDAGNQLQKIFQKQGIESARLDPSCDGYIYWTIADVGNPTAQGLFNPFWEPKASTAEEFRGFNGPVAILAEMTPADRIFAEADELKIEWWISHFGWEQIKNQSLRWQLNTNGKTILDGKIPDINVLAGRLKDIGTSSIRIPSLTVPLKAKLTAEFENTNVKNSWDIWMFPKIKANAKAGKGICASEKIYSALAARYPGLTKFSSAEAENCRIILTDKLLTDEVQKALEQGKTVVSLELEGPNPGVGLGWWWKGLQTGTAILEHPAFGDFPNDGYLNDLFFRIIKSAAEMKNGGYKSVQPIMAGHGRQGYLLYVFQAKAANGKILASGLDLLSEKPEAAYLLNEFINYVKSDKFNPTGILKIPNLEKE